MFRLWMWSYSLLYSLWLLTYLPGVLYRSIRDRRLPSFLWPRFGRIPHDLQPGPDEARPIWIHAVSVGEVQSIRPLVEALDLSRGRTLISSTTQTGYQLALDTLADKARIFYFPFDWKWICRRYLCRLDPALVVLTETEIWPSFLAAARSLKVPVILLNGRISDRSFRGYGRIRFFVRTLLGQIDQLCMQSLQDKKRILELGAPSDRVRRTGNLKYDYTLPEDNRKKELVQRLGGLMKSDPQDLVWICGSTREEEEALLLPVLRTLWREFPSLKAILAPRHPHRSDGVAALLKRDAFRFVRRSQLDVEDGSVPSFQVLLLDNIGELNYLYELADVVFVGGSLVGWGGHNILEVAHFGKPILFGPHMANFREISETFLKAYAALQVRSPEELTLRIRDLLRDPSARRWLGLNARKVLRDNRGAVHTAVQTIRAYL